MMICPLIDKLCRHCSKEFKHTGEFTRIFKDLKTGFFMAAGQGTACVPMGEFCNNDGRHFVRDLKECPAKIALGVPLVPLELSELQWMSCREVSV